MVSEPVHSHSIGRLECPVCCLVWIIIPYKEAFHILWYQTVQKVHCVMCQVQLTVPVGLHHQRNICCKTWHKKPGTEVCIGCHTLCWQFYHQWTDVSWCVAPACCLHTVVPGIVCDSRDIPVKFHLFCYSSCLSPYYSPFNLIFTPFDWIYLSVLPHHLSWYECVTSRLVTDMSCGNMGQ